MQEKKFSPFKIFICTHKPFKVPQFVNDRPDIYRIITNSNETFKPMKVDLMRVDKMQCDYGDNQNLCLNEWRMINAIYHMKNLPEYIGICHYRRYFMPDVTERLNMKVLEENGYEMVIGQPIYYRDVLKDDYDSFTYYGYWHNYEDFLKLEEVVKDMYPSLSDAFDEMKDADHLYNSAMMILHRNDFIDLCEFNFSIYDELMKVYGFKNDKDAIDYVRDNESKYVKPYNKYYDVLMQSRIVGFLLERATNTWLREKRDDGTSILDHAAQVKWFMPNEKDIEL